MCLENKSIYSFNMKKITHDTFLEQINSYKKNEYKIFVGTDSKVFKNKTVFITAICLHKQNEGSKIFLLKENIYKKKFLLKERIALETYKSIEIGLDLQQLLDDSIEIHLDVGATSKSKTSMYERELQNMVVSQGFLCKIKPFSWAASSVADHYVKAVKVR